MLKPMEGRLIKVFRYEDCGVVAIVEAFGKRGVLYISDQRRETAEAGYCMVLGTVWKEHGTETFLPKEGNTPIEGYSREPALVEAVREMFRQSDSGATLPYLTREEVQKLCTQESPS
jgi:hypothetical protein